MLQNPLEQAFRQSHRPLPDCIVADMFFPWATDSAAKFGVPRIVFHGNCFFSLCVTACVSLYKPYEKVSSDSEAFVVPNLPGGLRITSSQIPDFAKRSDNVVSRLLADCVESEMGCYGVLVNSFYELEKEYADHYRNVLGRKAWHIGPVSLCNTKTEEKANRGKETSINEEECLKWLDTKNPNSVVYVCFGSMINFPDSQLREIAMGLEASGKDFIWVLRETNDSEESWLPEGFEKRMESQGKGMIIRGWAPQMLILEHEAIGVFVTHCGWNSTLEAICGGVVMVTWPVAAEQFYNEKLVTEVVKIGLPIGVKKWSITGESVKWGSIEKIVKKAMEGEEAEEMRNKAKVLSRKAKEAVQKGGSSYNDLSSLIEGLASRIC
ncbi:scopoletin glucosyltransferase-like [Senna tora]|uniref:Scopoletin glucosyltransferase-like n=1 Tax=Senna tora TaxID=362788 RepID=A0A835CG07_9FABA|nr:scopoletin glucosyltransferase-like [Senna tora]